MSEEPVPNSEGNGQTTIAAKALEIASHYMGHIEGCPAVESASECDCGAQNARLDLATRIVALTTSPYGATVPPDTARVVLTVVVLGTIPKLVGSPVRYKVLVQPSSMDGRDLASAYMQLAAAAQAGMRQLAEIAMVQDEAGAAMKRKGG